MITFRSATRRDIPTLIRLNDQMESSESGLSAAAMDAIFDRIEQYPDYTVYIAEESGEAIGTFTLVILDALGERCRPVGIVEDVVVDRSARNRGVGTAMMQFARERCREKNCYKMMLSSNLVRDDAHRFYERLGWKKHGYSFLLEP